MQLIFLGIIALVVWAIMIRPITNKAKRGESVQGDVFKTIGSIILLPAIVLGIYALQMDTSVAVDYNGNNTLGLPERVNNLGLMNDKQTYLIFAGLLVVVGVILYLFGTRSNQKVKDTSTYRKCPQCAENIKIEAKVCRFCNYKFPENIETSS